MNIKYGRVNTSCFPPLSAIQSQQANPAKYEFHLISVQSCNRFSKAKSYV